MSEVHKLLHACVRLIAFIEIASVQWVGPTCIAVGHIVNDDYGVSLVVRDTETVSADD